MAIVRSGDAYNCSSQFKYHVLLSFRGEDTRKNFTDHLYAALVNEGLNTFRDDDEIRRGENIKLELEEAIRSSRSFVIVFSKNYASSGWCLDELALILQLKQSRGLHVLPVFYDVDPTNIRRQTGSLSEAFSRHEMRIKNESDERKREDLMNKVKGWRAALEEVADLSGMVLQNEDNGHEAKFIQKIVKVIADKINYRVLHVANHPVGLRSRAEGINQWVQDGSSSINLYLICGMGGIGKTTIAKHVYNSNNRGFGSKIFLSDIRETSEQPNGLLGLQKEFLSQILKKREIKICNIHEGTAMIKDALSCEEVFLVLDDVSEVHQLDALLGTRQFYSGSKIIITTRNKWLLKSHEVHKVYEVENLNTNESSKLFNRYAFGQDDPLEDYLEISTRVVQHCGGLPLAHKVLGSSLSGKSIDVWESELKKLQANPDCQIQKVLKISYSSLQDAHDKKLFLHIACFFVGMAKDDTIKILDGCGFFTVVGIENLTDRCLITVDENNRLTMHDLIKEMGRDIVFQESPDEPEKRSRLWHHKDSLKILKKRSGTEAIEGLMLDMRMLSSSSNVNNAKKRQLEELSSVTSSKRRYLSFISWLSVDASSRYENEVHLSTNAFARMHKLKLLQLRHVQLTGSFVGFPQKLRWLSWHQFPYKIIPMDLPLAKVVVLDMSYSKLVQVWNGAKFLGSLKILNLSYSKWLTGTPDFSFLPYVEKVILRGCESLIEVCETIEYLERLTLLNLKDCKRLWKLPNLNALKCLETLIISGCSNLGGFPMNLRNLETLKELNADGIMIADGKIKAWNPFTWSKVLKPMKSSAVHLSSLPQSLVSLSLAGCNLSNDSFPNNFSNLSSLRSLNLSMNPIVNLPDCVRDLSKLKTLVLQSCKSLKDLLDLPSVEDLFVGDSRQLQRVTYQSAYFMVSGLELALCSDLDEVQGVFKLEPVGAVDRELISSLGWLDITAMENLEISLYNTFRGVGTLNDSNPYSVIRKRRIQVFYEFDIFNTFIPGGKVPGWFSYKSLGKSISFTVPLLSSNLKLQGLNVCSVYAHAKKEEDWFPPPLYMKIRNKTKDLVWIFGPYCFGIPEAAEDMLWLSHWENGDKFESGDEIDVKIVVGDCFKVKECGVNLVYKKKEELEEQQKFMFVSWRYVGADWSSFQLSTGAYFLCHKTRSQYLHRVLSDDGKTMFREGEKDWTRTSWFQDLFDNSIEYEEVRYWGWHGHHSKKKLKSRGI